MYYQWLLEYHFEVYYAKYLFPQSKNSAILS